MKLNIINDPRLDHVMGKNAVKDIFGPIHKVVIFCINV